MSNKMTCPGCDSYTSAVMTAFEEDDPCPYCGLAASVTVEILGVRKRHADAELTQKYEEALKRVGLLEARNRALQEALGKVMTTVQWVEKALGG